MLRLERSAVDVPWSPIMSGFLPPMQKYVAAWEGLTFNSDGGHAIIQLILSAGASSVVCILSASISQSSDYGNDELEAMAVAVRRYGTSGTSGSALSEYAVMGGYAAADISAERTATPGVPVDATYPVGVWNAQQGWCYNPEQEELIYLSPHPSTERALGIELLDSPQDTPPGGLTLAASISWGEIGG